MAGTEQDLISEFSLVVPSCSAGMRLDSFLSDTLDEFSRSYLKKLVLQGCITLNGLPPKPAKAVKAGDLIAISIPAPEELSAAPQNIPISVIYEDADIIVVNKSADMVVHPSAGHPDGTLVNALLYYCQGRLSAINGVLRPGIVHRLDRCTSGVIVAAKNDHAHHCLVEQFKERKISKRYLAVVHGRFPKDLRLIDAPLGRSKSDFRRIAIRPDVGREARTQIMSVIHIGRYSAVHVYPQTGRTHQIRVHLKSKGHPILCDDLYGNETTFPSHNPVLARCALHSYRIEFDHPSTAKRISFRAPLSEDIKRLLFNLRSICD